MQRLSALPLPLYPQRPTVRNASVAVTACPTGVAHTFMAAEAIETEAKKTRLVGES